MLVSPALSVEDGIFLVAIVQVWPFRRDIATTKGCIFYQSDELALVLVVNCPAHTDVLEQTADLAPCLLDCCAAEASDSGKSLELPTAQCSVCSIVLCNHS